VTAKAVTIEFVTNVLSQRDWFSTQLLNLNVFASHPKKIKNARLNLRLATALVEQEAFTRPIKHGKTRHKYRLRLTF
jgi:hypothetical protein